MSDPAPGALITLEGGEGAGKSTVLTVLRRRLEQAGREVVVTREPGGTPLGERLRAALLDPDGDAPGPTAEALLSTATAGAGSGIVAAGATVATGSTGSGVRSLAVIGELPGGGTAGGCSPQVMSRSR